MNASTPLLQNRPSSEWPLAMLDRKLSDHTCTIRWQDPGSDPIAFQGALAGRDGGGFCFFVKKVPVSVTLADGTKKFVIVLVSASQLPKALQVFLKSQEVKEKCSQVLSQTWSPYEEIAEVFGRYSSFCQVRRKPDSIEPEQWAVKALTIFRDRVYVSPHGVWVGKCRKGSVFQSKGFLNAGAFNEIFCASYFSTRGEELGGVERKIILRKVQESSPDTNAGAHYFSPVEMYASRRQQVQKKIRHCPHVTTSHPVFYETFQGKKGIKRIDRQYLYNQGDLARWLALQTRSFKEILVVAYQLASAVAAIHSEGVYHGDIKLQNVLVHQTADDLRIGLTDWDGAGYRDEQDGRFHRPITCTLCYLPPWELLNNFSQPLEGITKWEKKDCWALGRTLYRLRYEERGPSPMGREGDFLGASSLFYFYQSRYGRWRKGELERLDQVIKGTEAVAPVSDRERSGSLCAQGSSRIILESVDESTKQEAQLDKIILQLLSLKPEEMISAEEAAEALNQIGAVEWGESGRGFRGGIAPPLSFMVSPRKKAAPPQ